MSDSELSDLEEFVNDYERREVEEKSANNNVSEIGIEKDVKSNVEVPMDKILFADKNSLIQNLASEASKDDKKSSEKTELKRKPAWIDEDDDDLRLGDVKKETKFTGSLSHLNMDRTYKEYLIDRFKNTLTQPKWASLDSTKDEFESDSDDEILKTVGFVQKPPESVLMPDSILLKRLKDLNRATYIENGISSINFHPTSTAAMVTGLNGFATIYGIDGDKNEKLHSMHFKDFPILSSQLYPCGTKAIFGSKKNFYFRYDLMKAHESRCTLPKVFNSSCKRLEVSPCGRYIAVVGRIGEVHLLTANSNEVIHTFKQPSLTAHDVCFTKDSSKLICNDYASNVTIFSIRQRRIEHKFIDDGCIKGQVVRLSPNQRMLATGSHEGVVNIYDFDSVQKTTMPVPSKTIFNLTTSISDLEFNHSSEILAICSAKTENAIKLVHFPSGRVYSNFPTNTAKFGKIAKVKFSPSSAFLAFGTARKEVPLFRVKHFENY